MNFKIYPHVKIGTNAQIGDFVIIGVPPKGQGILETTIGDSAIIRSHTVIYAGNKIGNNFQTGHGVNIREENEIGNGVSIGTHSIIEHHVTIKDGVRIHSNVFIPEFSCLEENSWVGPCAIFINALHPLCPKAKQCRKGPTIRRGAKIGAGAVIFPSITIGEMALVGAGAVVTKDVPPRKVVVGNPAKVIRDIKDLECPYGLVERPY